jgi:hypothetical protein
MAIIISRADSLPINKKIYNLARNHSSPVIFPLPTLSVGTLSDTLSLHDIKAAPTTCNRVAWFAPSGQNDLRVRAKPLVCLRVPTTTLQLEVRDPPVTRNRGSAMARIRLRD